jgi:hypothetical protein
MNPISILAIVIAGLSLTSCYSAASHARPQAYQKSRQAVPKTTRTQEHLAFTAQAPASISHPSSSVVENSLEGGDAGAIQAVQASPPPLPGVAERSHEGVARAIYEPQTAAPATPQPSSAPTRPSKAGTHVTQSTQVEKLIGSKPVIGDDSELRN